MNSTRLLSHQHPLKESACRHRPMISMRRHAPDLDAFLRRQGIAGVRAEYDGGHGHGRFVSVTVSGLDRSESAFIDPIRTPGIKAMFLALLISRYPDWREAWGSFGDFRWDVESDEIRHTHYLRGPYPESVTHRGV